MHSVETVRETAQRVDEIMKAYPSMASGDYQSWLVAVKAFLPSPAAASRPAGSATA